MQDRVAKSSQAMIRKQLQLTKEQSGRLKALAKATARTESELLREALDAWLAHQPAPEQEDWKAGLASIAGLWADYPEIEEIMAERRRQRGDRRDRVTRRMRGKE